MEEGDPE
ncbi:hypothetical protein CP8484711_2602, partial [Chlamydia psittaci 84-8471/1]